MKKDRHLHLSVAVATCLTLFTLACTGPVGSWGDRELGREEFEAGLADLGPDAEAQARFSPEAMEAAVLASLTNRVLAADTISRLGPVAVFETARFSNVMLQVRSRELGRSLSPRAQNLTEAQAREATTVYETEVIYLPGATYFSNGQWWPSPDLASTGAQLKARLAASPNWRTEGEPSLGYSVIGISWNSPHRTHMREVSGLSKGGMAGPVVQNGGMLFFKLKGVKAPPRDELAAALRREDYRSDVAQAVGLMRRQAWRDSLKGRSEDSALWKWNGGEGLGRALSRASNDHAAGLWEGAVGDREKARDLVVGLMNASPLVVFRQNLPQTATARTIPPPSLPGLALARWWDRLVAGSTTSLYNKGLADLAGAVALGPSGKKSDMAKRATLANRAHRRLAQTWGGHRATWAQAISHGRAFMKFGDYEKARWWFAKALGASGRRPGELKALLSPKSPGDREALIWFETLGASFDSTWVPLLLERVGDKTLPDEPKVLAIEALGRLPDRGQNPLLNGIYRNTNEVWGVRLMAAKALERLTGRRFPLDNPGAR